MGRYFIVLLLAGLPIPAVAVSASDSDDWTIAEINPIEQIYMGQGKADGKTELVLELTEIRLSSANSSFNSRRRRFSSSRSLMRWTGSVVAMVFTGALSVLDTGGL